MTFRLELDPNRQVGYESRKAYADRCASGFWHRYIRGPNVLDIGCRGGHGGFPIVAFARPIELGDPDYDGFHLPVPRSSQHAIHASHVLEHVDKPVQYVAEWFSRLRIGGHLILFVPHAHLYERRVTVPPSRFSPEHLHSYTPASLLAEIERALKPNTYRIRELFEDDAGYDYALPIETHPEGRFEIGLVLERITPPAWKVES